jgi:nucleotide-binding universal stress UspA family protein
LGDRHGEGDGERDHRRVRDRPSRWCRALRDAGIKYTTVIANGRAASVISGAADEVDADVVIVGRRGRGEVAELLLGSVSHELVLHCKRPVLVISAGPRT